LERGFQGENLSLWTAGDWGLRHHLQFEEIGEQDGLVALGTATAESYGPTKHVAVGAAKAWVVCVWMSA
jgi:hypothetical protein